MRGAVDTPTQKCPPQRAAATKGKKRHGSEDPLLQKLKSEFENRKDAGMTLRELRVRIQRLQGEHCTGSGNFD